MSNAKGSDKTMKKFVGILLIATITLSLSGCFSDPSQTKRSDFAIQDVRNYVLKNGCTIEWGEFPSAGRPYKGVTRTVSDHLFFSLAASEKVPAALTIDYYFTLENVSTQAYFSLSAGKQECEWRLCQIGGKGVDCEGTLDPQTYRISVKRCKNTSESEAAELIGQALRLALPNIDKLLKDCGFSYTYLDFGFSNLDSSPFKANPPARYSPLKIIISDVRTNRAGDPEVYLQFTNTGSQTVSQFRFYIKCYGANGAHILGKNQQTFYTGSYDRPLPPGQTTSSQLYWGISEFSSVETLEAAVCQYKPEGGEMVEIPETHLHWVRMAQK